MRQTLYLIDGTALLYRSHFVFIKNPLVNSRGEHTSAIFGVVNSFLHFLELKRAENILISFDTQTAKTSPDYPDSAAVASGFKRVADIRSIHV